jgi:hypothetical protein
MSSHCSQYIYVVGSFDLAGAISVNNVARFNTETSQWEDLLGGANGVVYAVREYDGKIVIGGSFDFVGSTTVRCLIVSFFFFVFVVCLIACLIGL